MSQPWCRSISILRIWTLVCPWLDLITAASSIAFNKYQKSLGLLVPRYFLQNIYRKLLKTFDRRSARKIRNANTNFVCTARSYESMDVGAFRFRAYYLWEEERKRVSASSLRISRNLARLSKNTNWTGLSMESGRWACRALILYFFEKNLYIYTEVGFLVWFSRSKRTLVASTFCFCCCGYR